MATACYSRARRRFARSMPVKAIALTIHVELDLTFLENHLKGDSVPSIDRVFPYSPTWLWSASKSLRQHDYIMMAHSVRLEGGQTMVARF